MMIGQAAQEAFVAQNVFFWIIAAVMIFSALRGVTTKNIVHAALYLVVVLAGVAAQFILLGAEFVGVTQVLVYIGAVIVLFLFGIMLTRAKIGAEERADHDNKIPALLTAVLLAAVMGYSVVEWGGTELLPYTNEQAAAIPASVDGSGTALVNSTKALPGSPTTTEEVSDAIFGDYLVPFEAVSVLLLAALIGAIVLARKE